ncbi:MAG TPA: HAMP domain-containing histidine kinase [Candidatus Pygmaiobacter gallistercoris]|nr:HAMP domain-containing histidine kinase [Candidatus Pygmaiobacter gallistercoris]
MNKSISGRYFRTTALVLVSGITLLGFILMYLCVGYFRSDSESTLLTGVHSLQDNFVQLDIQEASQLKDQPVVEQAVSVLANATGSIFLMTDNYGRILHCSDTTGAVDLTRTVNSRILNTAFSEGEYTELGELSGIYHSSYYSAGCPLINSSGQVIGYIFASRNAEALTAFLESIFSAFIVSAAVMLLVSSILSILLTSRLAGPLRRITAAAQSFGNGDLSARAPVAGDDEVAQLAVTFNDMADKLQAVDASRQSFMGNIAHELRTPMTSIKGFVDGMLDGTIPDDRRDHYLKIVSGEVGRLTRLTHSMLDITKLETGEYVMSAVDFDIWETVSSILFSREQQFIEHAIRLTGFNPVKVLVHADPDIVHQVIYNIVDNALKFTPDGGTIDLSVTENQKQGFVTVAILNTGEGIDPEALPYVFERFFKADKSRGLHAEGSGLGLHICKQLINRSGGKIWAESEYGKNAVFYFTLPCGKPKPPERSRSSRNAQNNK